MDGFQVHHSDVSERDGRGAAASAPSARTITSMSGGRHVNAKALPELLSLHYSIASGLSSWRRFLNGSSDAPDGHASRYLLLDIAVC